MIQPQVRVGRAELDGQRLFDDGGPGALFELADTRTTTTGVIAATYRRTDHGPKATG